MRRLLALLILSVGLVCSAVAEEDALPALAPLYRCSDDNFGKGPRTGVYSGFYEAEFESSSFRLSKVPCEVWLTGDICPIFGKGKCIKGAEVKAYVTVEGTFSERGHFGHFGMWERELSVTKVIKVQRITD